MNLSEIYFWTDTIKDWKYLLKQDKYKQIIIDQFNDLSTKKLINVYAFVVMPNHFHIIWELIALNGKEMPHASFNKHTALEITNDLKINHPNVLPYFRVNDKDRSYRIWQRDPLAILIDSKSKIEQKINYIHNNPIHQKWNLATRPELYKWSSASFYDDNIDHFGFLKHYKDRF